MRFASEADAISYIFRSMRKLRGTERERAPDDLTRDVAPTRRLLAAHDLLSAQREYAVVTGSKGKGSTTVITARLLQHLGHRVGTITSPHLLSWRERIRVDGRMIPQADFLRILDSLSESIDEIEASLSEGRYFSPQGIFLAIALRWFDEQGVAAAVLEVGRGGRFDDIAVVPNKLALFTPIMLEHPDQLGPTVERIAWHKAGVIKPYSYAYSVPQQPSVMDVLQREAQALGAEFNWIAPADMGQFISADERGIRMELGRYGVVTLSLLGRYQIMNATLAVIGAGNMHGRLAGIPHGAPEYVERIRAGLADVRWPGRCQKLQERPVVYVDGAINAESAALLLESVGDHLCRPIIAVVGVPEDKDYAGVYQQIGRASDMLILTQTARNPSLRFPDEAQALAVARQHNPNSAFVAALPEAVALAKERAGAAGSVLIVGTQSIVADTIALWGEQLEVI